VKHFAYTASDKSGKIINGVMEAGSENAVIVKLHEWEYFPIAITPTSEQKTKGGPVKRRKLLTRISSKDVMTLTHQLSTLLDAGLPLDRSLTILIELTDNPRLKTIVESIQKNVQGGASLAESLAKHPKIFSKLYTNMVRSGEAGGVLEQILIRLSGFLENSQELKEYIVSAMIYPLLLLLVGGGAIVLMMTFVIPKFAQIFDDLGASIPVPTQILLSSANFIRSYWWLIFILLVLIGLVFRNYKNSPKGRKNWDNFKLNLPYLGEVISKIEVSRFSRTLGTLVNSGVPILNALNIVKDTLSNEVFRDALIEVHGGLKEGEGVSGPLANTKVFPPLAIHMITVGEETGALEHMLLKVADTYENDVKVSVKRVVALIEPFMIMIMGLLVGFVVISMLLAIFSVNNISF
jgi:general secretion pathway protein F